MENIQRPVVYLKTSRFGDCITSPSPYGDIDYHVYWTQLCGYHMKDRENTIFQIVFE
jgi:hypothetical protein